MSSNGQHLFCYFVDLLYDMFAKLKALAITLEMRAQLFFMRDLYFYTLHTYFSPPKNFCATNFSEYSVRLNSSPDSIQHYPS